MIFDSIQNKENYQNFPELYQALCFLSELPKGSLPEPNTVLIENHLFCNPVTLTSKPEKECMFEAHRKFCDLHYIVSGSERIATAELTSLKTEIPYSDEKDIEFLSGISDGCYSLKPGQFMFCFPNDAHKPAIMNDHPEFIKKVVFKIKNVSYI